MTLASLVVPYRGERFKAQDRLSELIAPPYDVISEAARSSLERRHPHNVVHLILPRGAEDRYRRAQELLARFRAEGVLVQDGEPGLDVLQQEFTDARGGRMVRTGMLGAVLAEPYDSGRVKPHERTHAGPKRDRLELLRSIRVMCEALLLMSRDHEGKLSGLLAQVTAELPAVTAELEGVRLRVWRVVGDLADRLAATASQSPLYIADGHHRYETARAFRDEFPSASRTLALIVSMQDPGLVVLPTHREVLGNPFPEGAVRGPLSQYFDLVVKEAADRPERDSLAGDRSHVCTVILSDGRMLVLSRRDEEPAELSRLHPSVRHLGVTWADQLVIPTLQSAAGGGVVRYSASADEVINAVRSGGATCGVLLRPPSVADVLKAADSGAFMPQKSTYFAPKVPSGLVMLDLQGVS